MREIDRILDIPRSRVTERDHHIRRFTNEYRKDPDAYALLPSQAAFLHVHDEAKASGLNALGDARGALGIIECGGGKTLALQLAMLREAMDGKRVLLLTKASLLRELGRERARWAGKYHLPVMPPIDDLGLMSTPCSTMTYGKLSHRTGPAYLETIEPDVIFLDEAHCLGRGLRRQNLWGWLAKNRHVAVHAVTGTMTNSSINDYAHLCAMVLRDRAPVPIRSDILAQWASVVDRDGEPGPDDYAAIAPLMRTYFPFGKVTQQKCRDALRQRIADTPGVCIEASGIGADSALSIRIAEPTLSTEAWNALRTLDEGWALPDGTELVDHLEVYAARRNLRLGFYRRWSETDAREEWLAARALWFRAARNLVSYNGFASLGEVSRTAADGMLPAMGFHVEHSLWVEWQAVNARPGAAPTRDDVWVDDGKTLRDTVAKWRAGLDTETRAVMWFQSHALVSRIQGMIKVPVFTSKATPPDRGLSAVMMGHSTGWNATHFNQALVLEHPHVGSQIEQLLARHHRTGQTRDVEFTIVGGPETKGKIETAAQYATQQTGLRQRALIADWS